MWTSLDFVCPQWSGLDSVRDVRKVCGRRKGNVRMEQDSTGAVLCVKDLVLQAGVRDLLRVEEWMVQPGERVGVVGVNGCGKSSLLRAIVEATGSRKGIGGGEEDMDEQGPLAYGSIEVRTGYSVGHLPQQAVSGSTQTVWKEASSQMHRWMEAKRALDDAEARLDPTDMATLRRLERATELFQACGGYEVDERIGRVLNGLGFEKKTWESPCSQLSGGWGMRVALARLLLSEPDLMLLDEPTNHLDTRGKAFLESFLQRSSGAVVLVSHERKLLDSCHKIVEVRFGKLSQYTCNFTQFLKERDERKELLERTKAKQDKRIEQAEAFIERFGAKATKASQAQSRRKMIDKIERIEMPSFDKHDDLLSTTAVQIRLPKAPPCARSVISVRGVHVGYEETEPLITDVSFELERGQKVVLVAPNGTGKSTLLKTLFGTIPPLNPETSYIRLGDDRVSRAFFTQDLAADLPGSITPLQFLEKLSPDRTHESIRSCLGSLGLTGDAALRDIRFLSGGEKARVALASFILVPNNFLLCDEISNHLDERTVQALCSALRQFEGLLIVASHDRRLLEGVATHTMILREGKAILHHGIPDEARHLLDQLGENEVTSSSRPLIAPTPEKSEAKKGFEERKEDQRRISRAKKRIPNLEREIDAAENALARLDESLTNFGSNAEEALRLHQERETLQEAIEQLWSEFETLEGILAQN